MFRTAIWLGALAMTSQSICLHAESIRYETSFGSSAGSQNRNYDPLSSVPTFDPMLGSLTSVALDLAVDINSQVTWQTGPGGGLGGFIGYNNPAIYLSEFGPGKNSYYIGSFGSPSFFDPLSFDITVGPDQAGGQSGHVSLFVTKLLTPDALMASEFVGVGSIRSEITRNYTYDIETNEVGINTYQVSGQDNYKLGITYTYSVPEPATWAMMLVGFGAIGMAVRRRRGNAKIGSFLAL